MSFMSLASLLREVPQLRDQARSLQLVPPQSDGGAVQMTLFPNRSESVRIPVQVRVKKSTVATTTQLNLFDLPTEDRVEAVQVGSVYREGQHLFVEVNGVMYYTVALSTDSYVLEVRERGGVTTLYLSTEGGLFLPLEKKELVVNGGCGFNPNHRLTSFIGEGRNLFSLNEAFRFAQSGRDDELPMVLYGEKGVGKTHLLEAIATMVSEAGGVPVFTTGQRFAYEFVQSLPNQKTGARGDMSGFRNRHKRGDVLLVDSLDLLKSWVVLGEVYQLIRHYLACGKRVVCTMSCAPSLWYVAPKGLRSLLGAGIKMFPPTNAVRTAFVERALGGREITPEALCRILSAEASFQGLRKIADRLRVARTTGSIGLDLLGSLAGDLLPSTDREITAQEVLWAVLKVARIKDISRLQGCSRMRQLVVPRQVASFLLRRWVKHHNRPLSFERIGEWLHRDHSTVQHSVEAVENRLRRGDAETLEWVRRCEAEIGLSARP